MRQTVWRSPLRRLPRVGVAGLLVWLLVLVGTCGLMAPAAQAKTTQSGGESVSVDQLPLQGRQVMALIYKGGPFQFDKDGEIFGNRERLLPASSRGYYREYTVKTPYERSRGARRIVCGGLKPATPETCYYTDNHYASFRKIIQ